MSDHAVVVFLIPESARLIHINGLMALRKSILSKYRNTPSNSAVCIASRRWPLDTSVTVIITSRRGWLLAQIAHITASSSWSSRQGRSSLRQQTTRRYLR